MPRLSVEIPSARFQGTVNDFELSALQFREHGGLGGTLSGSVRGITKPQESHIDASLSDLRFTTAALGSILDAVSPGKGRQHFEYQPDGTAKRQAK